MNWWNGHIVRVGEGEGRRLLVYLLTILTREVRAHFGGMVPKFDALKAIPNNSSLRY